MYKKIADEFAKNRNNRVWHEWSFFLPILKKLPTHPHIVDLGCGNGRLFNWLLTHISKPWRYTGIDPEIAFKEYVIARFKNISPEISASFVQGDFSATGLAPASVDCVCAIASWHHVSSGDELNKSEKELRRILKREGICLMTVWNLYTPRHILKYGLWHAWKGLIHGYFDCMIPWKDKHGEKHYRTYRAWTVSTLQKWWKSRGWQFTLLHKGRNVVFAVRP